MGPLQGVKVVELAGIGPAPFCGMLLADMGADVVSIGRLAAADLGIAVERRYDLLNRSKQAVAVNLKTPAGVALVKDLVASADLLIEGFRPGVMERLGLGPDVCFGANPRLVYGRMTGWGQDGPLKDRAGHDINYIAMTGALASIGPRDGAPVPPLNLVGDFGGGALYLAMGLLAALVEARASGRGQVVDAAMVDGVASLMTMFFAFRQTGLWENARQSNPLDGGAPWYGTYETSDGRYMAVGAIEKRFYKALLEGLGLAGEDLPGQDDRARWPDLRARFAEVFRSRTREAWTAVFAGSDACVTPVLDIDECAEHPLAAERSMFARDDDVLQPAPAPRFSRTPSSIRSGPSDPQRTSHAALRAWGIGEARIAELADAGVIPPAAG